MPALNVFISWSGEQTRELGHVLKAFLDAAFAGHVETFLSDADIAPGERFLSVINAQLDGADLGILLVSRSNLISPWLLFEAGALAGKTSRGSVIPVLVDLDRSELISPLDQFQNALGSSRADLDKLWKRLQQATGGLPNDHSLKVLTDDGWPALEAAFALAAAPIDAADAPRPRSQEEVLEEIRLGVNSLVRRERGFLDWPQTHRGLIDNSGLKIDVGQRLFHPDFGSGEVMNITGEGDKTVLHVAFTAVGPKKLLKKLAPITLDGAG
ncbi:MULTISPECIES: toll/interleukin-1 receptor domain-containing protein [Microbacterium]|uniref:toll/interleukin-1 receptor domain-containing protein n=1 Tax=Microbacterium TaxID=33882 RepID=UPI002782D714|nr:MULTISPECIES: toll/interleukin-1 receptor domain-containing protein [Microbacterium]MDQ1082209.1 hypothetical protein [Microbacterium sp. SORGH_AS_0344]MDQ1169020.1 hypothetical protein [Microbacterium proteolyticum]